MAMSIYGSVCTSMLPAAASRELQLQAGLGPAVPRCTARLEDAGHGAMRLLQLGLAALAAGLALGSESSGGGGGGSGTCSADDTSGCAPAGSEHAPELAELAAELAAAHDALAGHQLEAAIDGYAAAARWAKAPVPVAVSAAIGAMSSALEADLAVRHCLCIVLPLPS